MVGMGRGVSVGARRLSTVGEAVGLAVAGTGVNVGGIPAAVRVAAAVSAVALLNWVVHDIEPPILRSGVIWTFYDEGSGPTLGGAP